MSDSTNQVNYGTLMFGGVFTEENVGAKVRENISGVYVLSEGLKNKDGKYIANYVGRGVIGEVEDLRRRLLSHIKSPSEKEIDISTGECIYKVFWFQYEKTPVEAYYSECKYFHSYGGSKYLRNKNHPAKNPGSNRLCPVCGQ